MKNASFKMLKTSISNVLNLIDGLNNEQMNEIPKGLSNNMIWNVAHLLVTQYLLIYGLSNNPINLNDELITNYKKGSKPQHNVSDLDIKSISLKLKQSYDQLINDFNQGLFKNYKPYMTSYHYEITNFEEALTMVNLHYGLHVGRLLTIKKLL